MTKNKVVLDTYVGIELLLCVVILISTIIDNDTIASLGFLATFAVVFLAWVCALLASKDFNGSLLPIFIILCTSILVLLDFLVYKPISAISFDYFRKAIISITSVIFVDTITKQHLTAKMFEIIKYGLMAASLVFLLSYYVFGVRTTTGTDNPLLTMNFGNSNLLSLFLVCIAMYIGLFFYIEKKRVWRLVFFVMFSLMGYLTILTGSRNAIIALILFFATLLFLEIRNPKKKVKIPNCLIALLLIFPLAFAIIYMNFLDMITELFSFAAAEGKEIASRFSTWQYAFDHIDLIPSYYVCSGGTGQFQMHNTHLDLLCSYGIIVFAFVIIYFYKTVKKINDQAHSRPQKMALMCFLIVWVLGTFEAAFFSGGQGIYIFGGLFLILARYDFSNIKEV